MLTCKQYLLERMEDQSECQKLEEGVLPDPWPTEEARRRTSRVYGRASRLTRAENVRYRLWISG
jgi:hypothetical protein